MKQVLIVTYDLVNPGRNYESLLRMIKDYGSWARLGGSSYLIHTESNPVQVRDSLKQALDSNDKLFVGYAPAPSAWIGLPDEVSRWILATQQK